MPPSLHRQLCQAEMTEVVDKLLLEAVFHCIGALRTADGDPEGVDTIRLLTKTTLRIATLARDRADQLAYHRASRTGPFQSLVGLTLTCRP